MIFLMSERPEVAGTAGNECQLTGILKIDDGFRAPSPYNWTEHLDPNPTSMAAVSLPKSRPVVLCSRQIALHGQMLSPMRMCGNIGATTINQVAIDL